MKKNKTFIGIVMFMALSFLLFVLTYNNYARTEEQKRVGSHSSVIASAMWTFENEGVMEYLKLASRAHNYGRIVVTHSGGEKFIDLEHSFRNPVDRFLIFLNLIPIHDITSNVVYDGNVIGRITATCYHFNIYVHFFTFVFGLLVAMVVFYYLRVIGANLELEGRVEARTASLQKEIEERKKTEEALRESEEKYRQMVEFTDDWVWSCDVEGRQTFSNQTVEQILGYEVHEILGTSVFRLMHPEYRLHVKKWLQRAVAEKRGWKSSVTKWIHKDGALKFLETSAQPIIDTQGNLIGFRGIDRDITERKQAEEFIRQSEARYKALFDSINSGVAVYKAENDGEDFVFVDFNSAGEKIENVTKDKLIGQSVLKAFPGVREFGLFDVFQRVWRTGNPEHHPIAMYKDERLSGWRDNFVYKLPSGEVVAVYSDETERKKAEKERATLEEQLRQSHKMEAIGTLAGGIAHDFNNILFSMIGYTELALDDVPKGTLQHDNLQEVLTAGSRAKDLVQQILTFSRQADQEQKPVQVKLVVKEALKLLRASIPSTIDIKQNVQSDALVMGDATQIHQILMNLCTNAAHAMENKGGLLMIKLSDVKLDSEFVSNHPDLKPGPYINLTVSDTGHGMSSAVLDKMFDPFFTTKEKGKGTGMGLSVVHGIAHSHGGTIYAYSKPGKGSTFKVFLPAIERHLKPADTIEKPLPTGTEKILFIDDEPTIVNMGKQILESLGYNVATRTSSLEALELFKAQKDRFDLVITDLTMPQMTGDKLAGELIQIRPDIPVILCTGFSARIDEKQVMAMGVKAFVSKPILKRAIAETIRSVLDG